MQPTLITLIASATFTPHPRWDKACVERTDTYDLVGPNGEVKPVCGLRYDTRLYGFVRSFADSKESEWAGLQLPYTRLTKPHHGASLWRYAPIHYYHLVDPEGRAPHRAGVTMPLRHKLTQKDVQPLAPGAPKYGKMTTVGVEVLPNGDPFIAITATTPIAAAVKRARDFLVLRNDLLEQLQDTPLAAYL